MKTLKRSILHYLSTVLILLCVSNRTLAETIDVTDKEGRVITARLVTYDGKNVEIFRISDSKTFKVPIDTLSDKTRAAIDLWVKSGGNLVEKYEVTVNTGKTSRRIDGFDYSDEKRVNLEPDITVKNPHATMESRPLQITIIFLGRPTTSRTNMYVFSTQTFDIPKLAPLTSKKFKVDPISKSYDDSGSYRYGSRYLGYIWIIHNKLQTETIASASVPSSLTNKPLLKYLDMKSESYYSENLVLVERD